MKNTKSWKSTTFITWLGRVAYRVTDTYFDPPVGNHLAKALASCLGVLGLTNPPIGEALPLDPSQSDLSALRIFDPEIRTGVVAEAEFREIAV
jgi:hypothetical protein